MTAMTMTTSIQIVGKCSFTSSLLISHFTETKSVPENSHVQIQQRIDFISFTFRNRVGYEIIFTVKMDSSSTKDF